MRREYYEEAAWYVRFAIVQAQLESHIIADQLANRSTPISEGDVREWLQRARTSATSLNALSSRTDHIHPAVTQVLSNAKVLIDDLVDDLGRLMKRIGEGKQPDSLVIARIVEPHRALLDLAKLYDERMRGIRVALDEGGDALPIKVWNAEG